MTTPTLTPAQKGVLTKKAKYGPDVMKSIGAKGGATTVEKHGPAHMSAIGKKGLETRVTTRWDGDYQAYFTWLSALGNHATDPAPWNGAFPHPGDEPAPAHLTITPDIWKTHFHPLSVPIPEKEIFAMTTRAHPAYCYQGVRAPDLTVRITVANTNKAFYTPGTPIATSLPHIQKYSPTGMDWGYGGSGPDDLALSILTHHFGGDASKALSLYHAFKWEVVATMPEQAWMLTTDQINAWLRRHAQSANAEPQSAA